VIARRIETTRRPMRIAVLIVEMVFASSRFSPMSLISGLIGVGWPFGPGGVIADRTLPRLARSSGVRLNEAGSGLRLPGS